MMLLFFISALGGASQVSLSQERATANIDPMCDYPAEVLDVGVKEFDQDMKGGWRMLADKRGCEEKAAEMIRVYRERLQAFMPLLFWHEAQLEASLGRYPQAIQLMQQAKLDESEDHFGWNPYVDATISFLKNDKIQFLQAKKLLDSKVRPADWPTGVEWPQNGGIVAKLWECFGKPYNMAYLPLCGGR